MKRLFDIFFSFLLLVAFLPFLVLGYLVAAIDTQANGLFIQKRVGQHGKLFNILKIRTINLKTSKISKIGRFFRKSKFDELPQLIHVLLGQMSFVGPRPDIPGYYDRLEGENRKILTLKPGLTCEASLKYFNEEYILSKKINPLEYNNSVIFPDKVKMNLEYYYHKSFSKDLEILYRTVLKLVRK